MRRHPRTVVFDLSTYPDNLGRIREMYFACCYLVESHRYEYFDPRQAGEVAKLIGRLRYARELVSFNGKAFDLAVLRKHHGLEDPVPIDGAHTDLCEIINRDGRGGSLDEAVFANFCERKLSADRLPHDPVRRSHARDGCRSDVRQTYKLWTLYRNDALRFP